MDFLFFLGVLGWVAGVALFTLTGYSTVLFVLGSRPLAADPGAAPSSPTVTVVVSALRGGGAVRETLRRADAIDYPDVELVLALGEGGTEDQALGEGLADPLRVFVAGEQGGKAHTLNRAVPEAGGEFVLLLDEDSLVESDCIKKMLPRARGEDCWAVVGEPFSSNARSGVIQRTLDLESKAWARVARAKDRLGLFLPATGFFALVRRGSLPEGEAWDEEALAEDTDLSLRQEARGMRVRLSGARVGIEAPSNLGDLARQRLRWYKGMFDALWKNRGALSHLPLSERSDVAMSLLSPLAPGGFVVLLLLAPVWPWVLGPAVLGVLALYVLGAWVSSAGLEEGRAGVVLFSVPYAIIQGIVALAALAAFLLHVRVGWRRTPKSGDRTS